MVRGGLIDVVRIPERHQAEFEALKIAEGRARLTTAVLLGMVIFLAYSALVAWVMPDVWVLDTVVRFGVGLPLAIGVLRVVRATKSYTMQQIAVSFLAISISVWISFLSCFSTSPYGETFHTTNAVVIIYVIVMMRTSFLCAALVAVGLMGLQIAIIVLSGTSLAQTYVIYGAVNLSIAVSGLYVLADLNNERRRSFLLSIRDRKRLKDLDLRNRALDRLAETDAMTGLKNRRGLDRFVMEYAPEGPDSAAACLFLDVDNFKPYNDNYGHPSGDSVLIRIARSLEASCMPTDLICRYGGEEFAVIRPFGSPPSDARLDVWAESVRQAVERLGLVHEYNGPGVVTVSVGVASLGTGSDLNEVVAAADAALYRAKSKGRNCAVNHADL